MSARAPVFDEAMKPVMGSGCRSSPAKMETLPSMGHGLKAPLQQAAAVGVRPVVRARALGPY